MKQGDQVETSSGVGIFVSVNDKDTKTAYVRLKTPLEEGVLWIPLVEPSPIWECFPCNLFEISSLKVTKTLEQRQQEAHAAAMAAHAQREALLREQRRQWQEAHMKNQQHNPNTNP